MRRRMFWSSTLDSPANDKGSDGYASAGNEDLTEVTFRQNSNVVSSALVGMEAADLHMPCIDIDLPNVIRVMPSSTEGHCHLMIDHAISWVDYLELLQLLSEIGLVEEGFVTAAEIRGMTLVRQPWVRKAKP